VRVPTTRSGSGRRPLEGIIAALWERSMQDAGYGLFENSVMANFAEFTF
jgi:hypothetical protein